MITKEKFISIYNKIESFQKSYDKLLENPVLNVDYMSYYFDQAWRVFEEFISTHFTEAGLDWFNWWFFERHCTGDQAWDENGNVLPTETADDLWEIIKEHIK